MAPPFPPQGEQKQFTERPLKIYGEQFLVNSPLPIGVQTMGPTGAPTPPYLVTAGGIYRTVVIGDWIISNRYTGQVIDAISDEEFQERFGGGGGPTSQPV